MSLAVVGCTVVDVVFPRLARLPAWPRHTEFTPANLVLVREPPIVTLGGNGANAAYTAARCGGSVALHTRLGTDALGGLARRWLEDAGCRVQAPGRGSTAVNVTAANRRQQRATFFYPGTPPAMPKSAGSGRAPSHLLICGWPHPPLAQIAAGLRASRRRSTFTALDAGPILGRPWTLASLRGVFAALDLFIANEYEIRRITGARTLAAALVGLRRRFQGHVVVKRGAAGVLWLAAGSDEPLPVSSRRVRAINTVGAGDSFNGALLALLARGTPWPAALRAACATAASVAASPQGLLGVRLSH